MDCDKSIGIDAVRYGTARDRFSGITLSRSKLGIQGSIWNDLERSVLLTIVTPSNTNNRSIHNATVSRSSSLPSNRKHKPSRVARGDNIAPSPANLQRVGTFVDVVNGGLPVQIPPPYKDPLSCTANNMMQRDRTLTTTDLWRNHVIGTCCRCERSMVQTRPRRFRRPRHVECRDECQSDAHR